MASLAIQIPIVDRRVAVRHPSIHLWGSQNHVEHKHVLHVLDRHNKFISHVYT